MSLKEAGQILPGLVQNAKSRRIFSKLLESIRYYQK
jgi:hypothetical protein